MTSGVSIRTNMGKKYALEKDHIFPYAALKANGYDTNNRFKYALAQEITNRAVLAAVENRGKSDQPGREHVETGAKNFPSALAKQCIPNDPSLWEMGVFENFLSVRRKLLSDELNKFLSDITEMQIEQAQVSIADILAEGEHDGLE